MTLAEIAARAAAIAGELEALDGIAEWTPEQRSQFDALNTELTGLEARKADIEARSRVREAARSLSSVEMPHVAIRKTSDPYDLSTLRFGATPDELRGRARTAIERTDFIADEARQEIARKIDRVDDVRGVLPGLVLHTGNDAYQQAFVKGLAGRSDLWTAEERSAVARADEFRAAMSLTDANGGYAVPFTLDPTLILTNDGSTNPFRQACRVETITTDSWNGLSSAGVTASYDGSVVEVSDDSPTFAQPSITPKEAQAFVQGSIAISQDYRNLAGDLLTLFQDAKDNLEASIFATTASYGLVPLVVAYDTGSSIKTSATGDTFAVADVYNTFNQTPARARSRGAWFANNTTISLMRQFATANNYHAFLVDLGAGQPTQLLGQPLYEASAMDGVINAGAENYMLVHGNPKSFAIVDRVGMSVEFIPHLFNTANNLPDGRRGWFAYWRTASGLLNGNDFTVLNVT